MARRMLGPLLAKGTLFAVTLAALLSGFEALLTSATPWHRYEDPRARILWDGAFDGTPLVLIGGSEFASIYVDSLSETLWARLETYTGHRVFPGALNGARPPDVLAAAVHVSREWPEGTTVFISLAPTRFAASRVEEPPTGNFAEAYFRLYGVDAVNRSPLRRVHGEINRRLLGPFFASRTRSALANLVDRPQPPGWARNRTWLHEHDVPKARFELFEGHLELTERRESLAWLGDVTRQLAAGGLRPVFVLTPLNDDLVHSFASVHAADVLLHHLNRTRATVQAHLEELRVPVVDITAGTPPECFFDLVHVNACGDDRMARRLAEWMDGDLELEARRR
jgi:hypothetical protein